MFIDNELIVSAKLDIYRLGAVIDENMSEALLTEANERCYAIPAAVLADLVEPGQPSITFEFNFHRRKYVPASATPPAKASSKKRKRPAKRPAQDSDSDPQYQPQLRRRRRREGPGSIIGASSYSFMLVAREIWDFT